MIKNHEFYLTLVRHAESLTNATPNYIGQTADVPLSENGIKQAKLLGERLTKAQTKNNHIIDFAFSSTYIRAIQTAKIALKDTFPGEIVQTEELREYSAGDWIGNNRNEILTTEVKYKMASQGFCFLPPNGESLHQVERRASNWLENNILYNENMIKISEEYKNRPEGPLNIFCFSHGLTIKCILHYIMGFDQNFAHKIITYNTSLTKLYFNHDGWRVICINDCSHLD